MPRLAPLSGFPEWLPEGRIVEKHVIDVFSRVAESHGFTGIETRAVEPISELARKGEIDKELYVLSRLQADPDEAESTDPSKQLGLHFDLTVPLARYVLEHAGHLLFPFKRYQVQKVWRGERPQDGRFREFYQADLDVIGDGALPAHYDAELPLVMAETLSALPLPGFEVRVNNRKVAEGFYRGLGFADHTEVLRIVDKLPKIGPEKVGELLVAETDATPEMVEKVLAMAQIRTGDLSFRDRVEELGVESALLSEGLDELAAVIAACAAERPGQVVADLSIARGLDYYTGTVYETFVVGHESLGSICSGGRYDTLATDGKRTYPGVGMSIGLSRLVSRLLTVPLATVTRSVPAAVLVAVTSEETRPQSAAVAAALRGRGIPVETAPTAAKFGKQIRYADRRGIPYVWFPDEGQVKDIRSGEQVDADASTWECPAEDLHPRVVPAAPTA
jgi:histidyl-tRNA synthetase